MCIRFGTHIHTQTESINIDFVREWIFLCRWSLQFHWLTLHVRIVWFILFVARERSIKKTPCVCCCTLFIGWIVVVFLLDSFRPTNIQMWIEYIDTPTHQWTFEFGENEQRANLKRTKERKWDKEKPSENKTIYKNNSSAVFFHYLLSHSAL